MSLAGLILRKLFFLEQWCVGYAQAPIERFLANPAQARITWIRPRGAREALADPFGLERNGALLILAERLVHGARHGRIVAIDPASGQRSEILACSYHLSYPFLIEEDGRLFLVPEQSESGALAFYRLDGDRVTGPVATIEGLDALDPSFVRYAGRWWLFCARACAPHTLHLFFAERLLGPYRPHPENPVVTDPARARPAGRLVALGPQLLRPGQDCRKDYGAAITLSEIDELSESRYRERPVQRLEPYLLQGGFARGLHTLDHTPRYVFVDSKRYVFHPLAALFKLRDRLRRASVR